MEDIAKNPGEFSRANHYTKIEWVFYSNTGKDGLVGPAPELLQLIKEFKIPYRIVIGGA
jgi:hypothetical protein